MKEARLQIAFGGLHPDRVRGVFVGYGPRETLRRLESGDVRTTARVCRAVAVSADMRRAELARFGIDVVWRGESGYPEVLAMLQDAPDLLFVPVPAR